jgi:tetratricopeptide (TPR) repeat protein
MSETSPYLLRLLCDAPETSIEGASLPGTRAKKQLSALMRLVVSAPATVTKNELARAMYHEDHSVLTDTGIENALSRLRTEHNLPVTEGAYSLNLGRDQVDILDFDDRAAAFIQALSEPARVESTDIPALLVEGGWLHALWRDPRPCFSGSGLEDLVMPFVKRHSRFGRAYGFALALAGKRAEAEALLDELAARYDELYKGTSYWTEARETVSRLEPRELPGGTATRGVSSALPAAEVLLDAPRDNLDPANYARFSFRKAYDEVLEQLGGSALVIQIHGLGGQGKTSLAHHVARSLRDAATACDSCGDPIEMEPFEAVIWTSDEGTPGELDLGAVLDTIIRTLDYPGQLSVSIEEKIDFVYRALYSHRSLLVVDNCETVTDRELFGWLRSRVPDRSRALLTTREPIEHLRDRSALVVLQGLDEDEAADFVNQTARGRELADLAPADTDELVESTGGNPLAIELALGLVARSGLSLDSVLNIMAEDPSVVLDRLFAKAWASLTPGARAVLVSAVLLSPVTDQELLMRVSGRGSERELMSAVMQLVDLSLLKLQPQDSLHKAAFYRVHPLVAHYVHAVLPTEDYGSLIAETRQSWLAAAVHLASQVGFCVDDVSRLKALDIPGRSRFIENAARWALAEGYLAEAICIAREARYYFYVRGIWDEDSVHLVRAEAAQKAGDVCEELDALTYHLNIAAKRGGLDSAEIHIRRLDELAPMAALLSHSLTEYRHARALFDLHFGRFDEAETGWRSNLSSLKDRDPAQYSANLRWLAICLQRANRANEALPLLDEAAEHAKLHGYSRALIAIELERAEINVDAGNSAAAKENLLVAGHLVSEVDDRFYEATLALLEARVSVHRDAARELADKARDLFRRLGHTRGEAQAAELYLSLVGDDA